MRLEPLTPVTQPAESVAVTPPAPSATLPPMPGTTFDRVTDEGGSVSLPLPAGVRVRVEVIR